MSKARTATILILMLAFSCLSRVGFSQAAEGDIQGIVVNAQGQLRAQATIRAVNVETVLTRTAITAADGTFSLVALPPGVYKYQRSATALSQTKSAWFMFSSGRLPRSTSANRFGLPNK